MRCHGISDSPDTGSKVIGTPLDPGDAGLHGGECCDRRADRLGDAGPTVGEHVDVFDG